MRIKINYVSAHFQSEMFTLEGRHRVHPEAPTAETDRSLPRRQRSRAPDEIQGQDHQGPDHAHEEWKNINWVGNKKLVAVAVAKRAHFPPRVWERV
ncbi:MAG: hypothetical protein CMK23_07205 [Porticoccaceae bacterium]|nr:hypothetical protein [Porticoccaceae bacterium]